MAKRQIDSETFKDDWFYHLSPQQKLLWLYAITNADCAGIISLNPSILTPILGWKIKDSEIKALLPKMTMLRSSTYIINNFIRYQHGYLGGKSKMLVGVQSALFKYGMSFCIASQRVLCNNEELDRVSIPYRYGIEIEIEVEKRGSGGDKKSFDFCAAWDLYPRKLGRIAAEKHFKAQVKTQEDYDGLLKAISNYKKNIDELRTEERFIKHGSTFFNNWKDWVDYKNEAMTIEEKFNSFFKEQIGEGNIN